MILAGLGVTGAKVVTRRKDREYRSTQGAGYRPDHSLRQYFHQINHTGSLELQRCWSRNLSHVIKTQLKALEVALGALSCVFIALRAQQI